MTHLQAKPVPQQEELYGEDSRALLPNPEGLHGGSPAAAATGSKQRPHLPSLPQAPSGLLEQMATWQCSGHSSLHSLQRLLLSWAPLQTGAFGATQLMGQSNKPQ